MCDDNHNIICEYNGKRIKCSAHLFIIVNIDFLTNVTMV